MTYNCLSIDGDTSHQRYGHVFWQTDMAGNDARSQLRERTTRLVPSGAVSGADVADRDARKGRRGCQRRCWSAPVAGAPDQDTAIIIAKSVIRSPLFKCAMFGEDANWGRILCAIGYADAEFDINKVDVDLASSKGTIAVCRNAAGVDFSEEKAKEILEEDEIYINIDLHQGEASAKAWGCDLTYDYVKINGDYRS